MEKNHKDNNYTVAGTNINQVKKLNDESGMSYNEVKEWEAKITGAMEQGSMFKPRTP